METSKRHYDSLQGFVKDLAYVWNHRKLLTALSNETAPKRAFHIRLMLTVVHANECAALYKPMIQGAVKAGVSTQEAEALLAGDTGETPESDAPAVLYAQHWTQNDGQPNPEATAVIERAYGKQTLEEIHCVIRSGEIAIRVTNTLAHWKKPFGLSRGG